MSNSNSKSQNLIFYIILFDVSGKNGLLKTDRENTICIQIFNTVSVLSMVYFYLFPRLLSAKYLFPSLAKINKLVKTFSKFIIFNRFTNFFGILNNLLFKIISSSLGVNLLFGHFHPNIY